MIPASNIRCGLLRHGICRSAAVARRFAGKRSKVYKESTDGPVSLLSTEAVKVSWALASAPIVGTAHSRNYSS